MSRYVPPIVFLLLLYDVSICDDVLVPHESPTYYCGLHCVYAAAQVKGVNFEFENIIRPEFLSGDYGSTVADLVGALESVGLNGYTNDVLTLEKLRLLDCPVILHVRPPSLGRRYYHWLLFLGFEGDEVKLYDPPREVGTITQPELLSIWDGRGVIVARNRSLASFSIPLSITIVLYVLGVCLLLAFFSRRFSGSAALFVTSVAACATVHGATQSGFFRSSQALRNIQASFFDEEEVSHIEFAELTRMMNEEDCLLVDARTRSAYQRFHIPNAVSVPIDGGILNMKQAVESVREGQQVIVYCQSEQCGWAEKIATQMQVRGARNVFVYTGGVNDWKRR